MSGINSMAHGISILSEATHSGMGNEKHQIMLMVFISSRVIKV
jgi:hypothetical protein